MSASTDEREKQLVIFTDLDGTLLDRETYSFEAARQALDEVRRRKVPLVLCTSKTRAEVKRVRRLLDNHDPFIVENGGAAFIPRGYFPFSYPHQQVIAGYHAIRDGLPYASLVRALREVRVESGAKVVGFSDLSVEEVAQLTGLSREEAHLAKKRECDEPFLVVGSQRLSDQIRRLFKQRGFMCTRGGMFDHLIGHNGKGRPVSVLAGLFRRMYPTARTVGIGDSQNDLPMLRVVDVPVLVERPDGTHDPTIDLPHLIRVQGVGPIGWGRIVLDLLSSGSEGG